MGRGLVMEIDFDRDSRFWLGLYEMELSRHIRELCTPGSSCFDLGAESGFYGLLFAARGEGRVIAVEADPDTFSRMQRNVSANPELAPRIELVHGRVARRSDTERGTVAIDDLAYGEGGLVPDLVKLDVEGKEVAALEGAERLLTERAPAWIVETHSHELDEGCRGILETHGYEVETVEQRRFVPEVRSAPLNRWLVARAQ